MITENPQYKHRISPAAQFITFCAVAFGLILAGNFIALGIIYLMHGMDTVQLIMSLDLNTPAAVQSLWILQIVGTTLPILFTPIVFGKFIMHETHAYLRTDTRIFPIALVMIFFIMAASTPIMEVLITLNQKMQLPEFLKGLENWMRNSENMAQKATSVILKMDTWVDLVKVLFLVALVTAVAEELMFRGCLQTILLRWTNSTHLAIWITAALFSAFHMEFFGFLPRLMLGVFFGYFTAWTGSVWPAVWAHFLNNGTAVLTTYLYNHKIIKLNLNDQNTFSYGSYIFSVIITVILFWAYRKTAYEKKHLPIVDGKKLG